jgi:hypothetical protein
MHHLMNVQAVLTTVAIIPHTSSAASKYADCEGNDSLSMYVSVPLYCFLPRMWAKYKSRKCIEGGTQKLTKATQKHPTNASTSTKSGNDAATITQIETNPYRTIT